MDDIENPYEGDVFFDHFRKLEEHSAHIRNLMNEVFDDYVEHDEQSRNKVGLLGIRKARESNFGSIPGLRAHQDANILSKIIRSLTLDVHLATFVYDSVLSEMDKNWYDHTGKRVQGQYIVKRQKIIGAIDSFVTYVECPFCSSHLIKVTEDCVHPVVGTQYKKDQIICENCEDL